MSRTWLALVEGPAIGADAVAEARDVDGRRVGLLAAWTRRAKPSRAALRVDPRLIDARGEAAWVSLVLAPPGASLLFDDLAVQHARRRVLAEPPAAALSTLLRDSSHFAGALTAQRGADALAKLRDDPFARIFAARVLHVGAGLLASGVVPAGPVIERYGSENPWPWDRFPPG